MAETATKPERVQKKGVDRFREGSTRHEAVQVLREADGPLHTKEITERILARGKAGLKGKTPEATVAAQIVTDSKRDDSPFRKTKPGTFGLKPSAKK